MATLTKDGGLTINQTLEEFMGNGSGAMGGAMGIIAGALTGMESWRTPSAAIKQPNISNPNAHTTSRPVQDVQSETYNPPVDTLPTAPAITVPEVDVANPQPNAPNEDEDEEKNVLQTPDPSTPEDMIQDTTGENEEFTIDWKSMADWWEAQRNAAWEREDQIRAETQAREDNAWRRSVADMIAAGINPNLVNASPAASGGGITQASMPDMSLLGNALNLEYDKILKEIDQNFEGDQNTKDRVLEGITSLLQTASQIAWIYAVMKGKKTK